MVWAGLSQDVMGFFFAGLLNNMAFVIMIAGAKNIAPSLVGVVYACNIIPSFIVKMSGPYWFHFFPYKSRVLIAAILFASSFLVVALGLMSDQVGLMLFGVTIGSSASGFGESSFLALTAFYDSRVVLTAWSSGTGFAGILGYGWVIAFTAGFGASFKLTLLVALILPILYYLNFIFVLKPSSLSDGNTQQTQALLDESLNSSSSSAPAAATSPSSTELFPQSKGEELPINIALETSKMTMKDRLTATLSLWPFIIPLILVYFAEYAMQSGVWAAMGFPIDSENSRQEFYEFANWTYQGGVLISRSSGLIWKADMTALWIMPIMQCVLLIFFILNAYHQWWYDWSILLLCLVAGFFGGAVYVGGFSLIAEKVPTQLKEFSLSAASLGSDIGIACATVAGIFIQRAVYDYHNISDNDD
jgi:battenin